MLWNQSEVCLVEVQFALVQLEGPVKQHNYFIGLSNLGNCVFRKFETAGEIYTEVSESVANGMI